MREYSTAQQVSVPSGNLTDDVVLNAAEYPDIEVFSRRVEGSWTGVTAAEFHQDVRSVAKGLIASGVECGDRVALLSRTRYEWTVVDYAIWFARKSYEHMAQQPALADAEIAPGARATRRW